MYEGMRSLGTHICQRNLTDSRGPECSRRRRGLKEGEGEERVPATFLCRIIFLSPSSVPLSIVVLSPSRFFLGLFCVISITSDSVYYLLVPCQAGLLFFYGLQTSSLSRRQVSIDSSPRISHGVAPLNYRRSPSMINETAALN